MIIDAKIGGVNVDSILCGGKTIYSTGPMTPKEEYIALHIPNIGTNLFTDGKLMNVGDLYSGKSWIYSGAITPTGFPGKVELDVGAGVDSYLLANVTGLTAETTYCVSFKGTFTGVTGPAGASGFALSVSNSNYDSYSNIFTGTFEEVKSFSFTLGAGVNATEVIFVCMSNTGGTIKLEDMMLNPGTTPLPFAFKTLQELEDYADFIYP